MKFLSTRLRVLAICAVPLCDWHANISRKNGKLELRKTKSMTKLMRKAKTSTQQKHTKLNENYCARTACFPHLSIYLSIHPSNLSLPLSFSLSACLSIFPIYDKYLYLCMCKICVWDVVLAQSNVYIIYTQIKQSNYVVHTCAMKSLNRHKKK